MKQPTYHTTLPPHVRFDEKLPANAKLLYAEIKALCDERGYCWASNQFFAQLYGVEKKAVSRWISQLEQQQYIQIEVSQNKGNLRRIYPLTYPPEGEEVSSQKGLAHPISEQGYPPKKMRPTPSLLLDKNIDYNDRIHRTPSEMTIAIWEDREGFATGQHIAEEDSSEKEHRLSPHPPVAPPPPPRKKMRQSFAQPSVGETEEYMQGQKELCPDALTARAQALRFVNYYESNGWKVGRNAMKDWRAAANNWLLNAKSYADKAAGKSRNDIMSQDFDPYAPRLHSGGPKDYSIPL